MNAEELRLECLRLAQANTDLDTSFATILSVAQSYYNFVIGFYELRPATAEAFKDA